MCTTLPIPRVRAVAGRKLSANRILVVVLAVAVALAAVLIVISVTGDDDKTATPSTAVHGAATVENLLAGIPQKRNVLGKADAPVTIVEFADLQCPACKAWALDTFPAIVEEYVRPGKVKLVFNGMSFVGPDSLTALKTAAAAGEQNRLWNVVHLLYYNQGAENEGWVTEDLLSSIGESVMGLDGNRMLDERESQAVQEYLAAAQGQAQDAGAQVTPTFGVGRSNGQLTKLEGAVSADGFRQILDPLLAQK